MAEPQIQLPNVALVGSMRSGKDSVAAALRYFYGYERLSFADALKEEVGAALQHVDPNGGPYNIDFFNDEKNRLIFRPLLQWWGSWRREQDPEHWVRIIDQVLQHAEQLPFVVTDGRYLNELGMLKSHKFVVIELHMPVEELTAHLVSKGLSKQKINEQLDHPSEREWKSYPRDISFESHYGNLPRLAEEVIAYLTRVAPSPAFKREITEFFMNLYPETYNTLRG